MKKALAIFAGFVAVLLLLTLLWSLLAPGGDDQLSVSPSKRENTTTALNTCNKEGNTRKIYNLTFRNRQGQSLVVERVKFRNLNSQKARVFVVLSYSPRRPTWAEKRSNFRVLQPPRSRPPQFPLITAPSKVPGEDRYRQSLKGLEVVPQDVGISAKGEEPVTPLFLSITGFAQQPISVGLLTPSDCPVGQNTNLQEEVTQKAKRGNKSTQKKEEGKKQKKAATGKKKNKAQKKKKQG